LGKVSKGVGTTQLVVGGGKGLGVALPGGKVH
jgi:hypothetical protein